MRTSRLAGTRTRFLRVRLHLRVAWRSVRESGRAGAGLLGENVGGRLRLEGHTRAALTASPTRGAHYTDQRGWEWAEKRSSEPGKSCRLPGRESDGRQQVYYQSNVSGVMQVYRCKRDGTGVTSLTPPEQLTKQLATGQRSRFAVKGGVRLLLFLSADGSKMVFTVHDGKERAGGDRRRGRFIAPPPPFVVRRAPRLHVHGRGSARRTTAWCSPAPRRDTGSCSPRPRTASPSN